MIANSDCFKGKTMREADDLPAIPSDNYDPEPEEVNHKDRELIIKFAAAALPALIKQTYDDHLAVDICREAWKYGLCMVGMKPEGV